MASSNDESGERILQRAVLAGDTVAWQHWYARVQPALASYVHWRCGKVTSWTEDILQETWLLAVRKLAEFDPARGSFLNWLRQLAAGLIANRLRAQGRWQATLARMPAPENRTRETPLHVAEVLAALPAEYEMALRMKYLEEQSVAEMAQALGRSEKAMESLLSRARAAFRSAYQAEVEAP